MDKGQRKGKVSLFRSFWLRYTAAAILFLAIGACLAYWHSLFPAPVAEEPVLARQDIAPGGNKAILTLSDGSKIVLDSAANGLLANQGNTSITKLASGRLDYISVPGKTSNTLYNTLTTPRGGQYKLVLSDGTAVWLNASSSITYPAAFTGKEREVKITGEAYFEVMKNPRKPFRVLSGDLSVDVLGTHFNINAYPDEDTVKTTLAEGKLRASDGAETSLLSARQQSRLTPDGKIGVEPHPDLEEVLGWKNGLFHFTNADVPTLMRQLSRWYDVDIEYPAGEPAGRITGEVSRAGSLSKVLQVFETSGTHFRIEGKKIIVTP
jgi:transmembrane sensor